VRRLALRLFILLLAVVIAGYLSALGYLFAFQRDYVFKPSGELATPADKGLTGVEIVTLTAKDGTVLTGWYHPPKAGLPTLLYFHGNAGNISGRAERFRQVTESGLGFLAVSYRGYAGSGGSPSETALVSDGVEAFDWLAPKNALIVIYGESLGTGVAAEVATERRPSALILEAPFTAALDMAAATYPWVPVGILMRDPFISREHISRLNSPVLIIHGTADEMIAVDQGRKLFEFAHEPKQLAIIEGGAHSDLWDRGLWPIVLGFLRDQRLVSRE
jgi:fermentation-respiration switch protein FrsA (DUF1100 family)